VSNPHSNDPQNVIPLSQYRARLSRGRRLRRGEGLLEADDPQAAVRALPADELYYLLQERGFPEAVEILVHSSPEQVQTFFDFAVWDRDRLSMRSAEPWLAAIAECPDERIYEWVRGLDTELFALLLRRRARVYNNGLEIPPEEPEGVAWETPDGRFTFDMQGDQDYQRITRRLIESLYSTDLEYAQNLIVGVAGDLDAELEEFALRWRAGRMEDLGFADYYRALEIYKDLDPASVKIGEGRGPAGLVSVGASDASATDPSLRMPNALVERLASGTPFAQAVAGLADNATVNGVHDELVSVANRVLSADRVSPTDETAIAEVLERLAATLDLSVAFLCQGSDARATEAVETISIARLFRLGNALIGKVGQAARALKNQHPLAKLARSGVDLFEPQDSELLGALARPRPAYPLFLDGVGAGFGTRDSAAGTRPFQSMADIKRAATALEQAATSLSLLGALGLKPEHLGEESLRAVGIEDALLLDNGILARTHIVARLTHSVEETRRDKETRSGALMVLDAEKLEAFTKQTRSAPAEALTEAVFACFKQALGVTQLTSAQTEVARRWADSLSPLEPVITESGLTTPG